MPTHGQGMTGQSRFEAFGLMTLYRTHSATLACQAVIYNSQRWSVTHVVICTSEPGTGLHEALRGSVDGHGTWFFKDRQVARQDAQSRVTPSYFQSLRLVDNKKLGSVNSGDTHPFRSYDGHMLAHQAGPAAILRNERHLAS